MRKFKGGYQMTTIDECFMLREVFNYVCQDSVPEEEFSANVLNMGDAYIAAMNLWFINRYLIDNPLFNATFTMEIDEDWIRCKDEFTDTALTEYEALDTICLLLCYTLKSERSFRQLCKRLKVDDTLYKKIIYLRHLPYDVKIVDGDRSKTYKCGAGFVPTMALEDFIHNGWKENLGLEEIPEPKEINFGTISEEDMKKLVEEST
jgi:hypothetical protein